MFVSCDTYMYLTHYVDLKSMQLDSTSLKAYAGHSYDKHLRRRRKVGSSVVLPAVPSAVPFAVPDLKEEVDEKPSTQPPIESTYICGL